MPNMSALRRQCESKQGFHLLDVRTTVSANLFSKYVYKARNSPDMRQHGWRDDLGRRIRTRCERGRAWPPPLQRIDVYHHQLFLIDERHDLRYRCRRMRKAGTNGTGFPEERPPRHPGLAQLRQRIVLRRYVCPSTVVGVPLTPAFFLSTILRATLPRDRPSPSQEALNDPLGGYVSIVPGVSPSGDPISRIRSEYLEMPGLGLTPRQAQRLFGLDASTCDEVLDRLRQSGFLSRTGNGMFTLAPTGGRTVPSR